MGARTLDEWRFLPELLEFPMLTMTQIAFAERPRCRFDVLVPAYENYANNASTQILDQLSICASCGRKSASDEKPALMISSSLG